MTKEEKERILLEAVLSLNPQKIRDAGEKTGHPVRLEYDTDVVFSAAEMIVFFIPNAPREIRQQAMMIIGLGNFNFSF